MVIHRNPNSFVVVFLSLVFWMPSPQGLVHAKTWDHVYDIQLAGETFHLEVAADELKRAQGLGGRTSIDPDGGMIFVFPRASVRWFHMRDCVIPIDILFLDSGGIVTKTYTMQPEPPRMLGEPEWSYTQRLRRYYSGGRSQYVIELREGTIDRLGLRQGDRIVLDQGRLLRALR